MGDQGRERKGRVSIFERLEPRKDSPKEEKETKVKKDGAGLMMDGDGR